MKTITKIIQATLYSYDELPQDARDEAFNKISVRIGSVNDDAVMAMARECEFTINGTPSWEVLGSPDHQEAHVTTFVNEPEPGGDHEVVPFYEGVNITSHFDGQLFRIFSYLKNELATVELHREAKLYTVSRPGRYAVRSTPNLIEAIGHAVNCVTGTDQSQKY